MHQRTPGAAPERDEPELLQVLVEHVREARLTGDALAGFDRVDASLAVHTHSGVGRDRETVPFPADHRVAVRVELEQSLGEGADEYPRAAVAGQIAWQPAE